jgi:two-component system, OmpR family, response regulator VanR
MYISNNDKTVLVVEDDVESNDNISYMLKSKFREVFSAYDGVEGWKKYQEYNPDVILTDIEMPRVNGLELIKRVRADNATIPIVVLSSYSHKDYLMEAIPLKLEEYLLKPITMDKLHKLLQKLGQIGKMEICDTIDIDDDLVYNFYKKTIEYDGESIRLSHLEISLVELFLKRKNAVVTYEEIELALYGTQEISRNALKIVVSHLRKKIPALNIEVTPKVGYRLV